MSPALLPGLLKLLRPRQWTKNLVCLAGVFFGASLRGPLRSPRMHRRRRLLRRFRLGLHLQRRHGPRPRPQARDQETRPIASGEVSVPQAIVLAALFLAAAITLGAMLGPRSSPSLPVTPPQYLLLRRSQEPQPRRCHHRRHRLHPSHLRRHRRRRRRPQRMAPPLRLLPCPLPRLRQAPGGAQRLHPAN